MTENVTVEEAARTLAGMERFEEGLRRRAEGMTWTLLGLTLAGIGSSAAAGLMLGEKIEGLFLWPLQIVLPFLAWSVVGALAIKAVWSSAALHAPALPRSRVALRMLALLGALFAVVWPLMGASYQIGLTHPEWKQYAAFTIVLGLYAMLLGAWNVLGLSVAGRRTALGVGVAQVAIGAVVLALQTDHPLGYVVALGAIPGAWIAGGLRQTFQG